MIREAVLSFPDSVYDNNVDILQNQKPEGLDSWRAEVGLEGDRVYFELTPYHDRLVFVKENDLEMTRDLMNNAMQIAYPECMYRPFNWLPYTTQVSFDGQQIVNMEGLLSNRKPGEKK